MRSIFIANRGEIAIRIAQAVAELGLESIGAFAEDEADGPHLAFVDRTAALPGKGARAFLDIDSVVGAAIAAGADAVHPGYGFLAESADFAEAVGKAGLTFIGPEPGTLAHLGNKIRARELAESLDVPVAEGLDRVRDAAEAEAFLERCGGAILLKAAAGGGGRGIRVVRDRADLAEAFEMASREAEAAFGLPDLYCERLIENARHIEVQVIGDGETATHAWERDCSLQRRHQKVVEIAPAPALDGAIRDTLIAAALKMAEATKYRGLGTFEFLVTADGTLAFIEANPRLQVEHTVTEAITGLDLVAIQIRIARGERLAGLGLAGGPPVPQGFAVEARVTLESLTEAGDFRPSGGTLAAYAPPGGAGIRVDGIGSAGYRTSPFYDSLIAKVIAHAPGGIEAALGRCERALSRFRIEGVETNSDWLRAVLRLEEIAAGRAHIRLIDEKAAALAEAARADRKTAAAPVAQADAKTARTEPDKILDGVPLVAPMAGTVHELPVAPGEVLSGRTVVAVLEAMKMQHAIRAGGPGRLVRLVADIGETVGEGDVLAVIEPAEGEDEASGPEEAVDLDRIRPDLAELLERKALLLDEARPERIGKRHALGKRSARENVARLCDPDSFVEYGDLAFAAQRARRSVDDLIRNTPADGLITGFGSVNGDLFGPQRSRTAVLAYDYTVLAGTQGLMNHTKKDRIFTVIERQRTPVVMYCEGGGGRPGDVDASDTSIAGLYCTTFAQNAALSGLVPMIGIGSGRLFAGNAALLGCCDAIIATKDACIGMGGPAMIEGGGLGVFRPEEVGPSNVQYPNGVIDILVEDEVAATEAAKAYLAFFQGELESWEEPDRRLLRHVIPENRLEVYDVHAAIEGIADIGSVLELRAGFAPGMVTAFARVGGRTVGIVANNPVHLAGAIDSDGADKAARFINLCDSHDIPILTLIDTPGMMVGPDIEKTALVRHCSRVFLAGANASVPIFSVILRKSYGLGAQAMAGGSFRSPLFIVGWPTAEIGAMGLEGAVRLGYRKELEAVVDDAERQALFERMVAEAYQRGKAINAASVLEFDTVIDPAETRKWIVAGLDAAPPRAPRSGKKRPFVDAW